MTSPFSVLADEAQRPQNELINQPQEDAPVDEFYDPRLWWQKRQAAREQKMAANMSQDQINPMADAIGLDQIASRMQPIMDIGQKALVGNQLAAQAKAQREAQARAAQAERERMQSYQDALNSVYNMGGMNSLNALGYQQMSGQAGGGGSAGWGSGGAQGVANVLRAAGFPESAIPTMIAIARAESSWNPNATHRNSNGSIDQGLFQINSIHKNNSWYPQNPFDPYQSAVAAYNIWKGAGGTYRDWTVYNSGAYRQYLQAAPPIQGGGQQNISVTMGNTVVSSGNGSLRMTAIQKGINYVNSGVRYVWGGNNLATGVDCSGLVQQIYRQLGISLPRTAQQQAFYGTKAPISQLRPGDLVAWNNGGDRGLQVGHIAIYAGNGEIIESYQSGLPARRRKLSSQEVNSGYAWGVKIRFPGE